MFSGVFAHRQMIPAAKCSCCWVGGVEAYKVAEAKNAALRAAGAIVPKTFEDLPKAIAQVYQDLVKKGEFV